MTCHNLGLIFFFYIYNLIDLGDICLLHFQFLFTIMWHFFCIVLLCIKTYIYVNKLKKKTEIIMTDLHLWTLYDSIFFFLLVFHYCWYLFAVGIFSLFLIWSALNKNDWQLLLYLPWIIFVFLFVVTPCNCFFLFLF